MAISLSWADGENTPPPPQSPPPPTGPHRRPVPLPHAVESAIWRGDALGSPVTTTLGTGFEALDAELPGNGWPCQSLTEVLQVQPSVLEWRLLAPAMRELVAQGKQIVVVGPPKAPHLPGLRHLGLDERQLVWINADKPVERLWATEQLIKANAAGMLVSWLPQARQEQIRRLQVCAQSCDGPVILCRPAAAAHEASAAPLRLQARLGVDWELHVHLLKRKGPPHEGELRLPSIPGGLEAVLTPRLRYPSRLIAARKSQDLSRELSHAVGSPSSRQPSGRPAAAH
ncbi:protein ImuA [Variovorax sp. OK605]|nr:protein ImuA [Variovorax sp. OK605]